MCIFTFSVPIEISKRVFELVIFEKDIPGEEIMLRILFRCIKHTEATVLQLQGKAVYKYYSEATFILDTFAELPIEEIFY
jgi:hypothetical protein